MINVLPKFVLSSLLLASPFSVQAQQDQIPKITSTACNRVAGVIQDNGACSYKGSDGNRITVAHTGKDNTCKVNVESAGSIETMRFNVGCNSFLDRVSKLMK